MKYNNIMIITQITIIILALVGLAVSYYIFSHNKSEKQLACPIKDHNCGEVVNSKYNKTFGIKNEIAGMFYYILVAIIYLLSLFFPIFDSRIFKLILEIIITGAALFSVYLIFVQKYFLKQYCAWCLASAVVSLIIFILALTRFNIFAKM